MASRLVICKWGKFEGNNGLFCDKRLSDAIERRFWMDFGK